MENYLKLRIVSLGKVGKLFNNSLGLGELEWSFKGDDRSTR